MSSTLRAILGRMIGALRPGGGVRLIADQADSGSLATLPRRLLRRIVRTLARREPVSSDLSEAWAEHWRGDTRPRHSEAKTVAAELMPGAKVTSHPHSTYSIVWRKP